MIAILNYDAGNIKSVQNALTRLGVEFVTTDDLNVLDQAEKIIFPGVGHAGAAMKSLKEKKLDVFLKNTKKPVLGICVGMQLLLESSEEGDTECLGLIPGKVIRFEESRVGKVPHINWCEVSFTAEARASDYFYFVHSYYVPVQKYTVAKTSYGEINFSAAVKRDNYYGTQFHPEKSGDTGALVLKRFINDEL